MPSFHTDIENTIAKLNCQLVIFSLLFQKLSYITLYDLKDEWICSLALEKLSRTVEDAFISYPLIEKSFGPEFFFDDSTILATTTSLAIVRSNILNHLDTVARAAAVSPCDFVTLYELVRQYGVNELHDYAFLADVLAIDSSESNPSAVAIHFDDEEPSWVVVNPGWRVTDDGMWISEGSSREW